MRAKALKEFGDDASIIIGVNGSIARREVTSGSDVDLFFLYHGHTRRDVLEQQNSFRCILEDAGYDMPAPDGVFANPLSVTVTREMIGGLDDTNEQITRRMLLLLEGEWIFNQKAFEDARRQLLKQYVPNNLRDEQICLFLLNDIIRYWRTICVDFEYKVQNDGKPRAIRLIKLRFSRMLLFLAGVFAIGETQDQPPDQKIETLSRLLSVPAYERLHEIAGDNAVPALELYAEFLNALDDESVRTALKQHSPKGEQSGEFKMLREKAHEFRNSLIILLRVHYGNNSPTIAALML